MNYFEYLAYIEEAKNYATSEDFLGEMGFGANVPYSAENWGKVCEIIFAAAHSDFAAITGELSARAFAMKYSLPDRTVQRWIQGERKAPEYVACLLGYAVIGDIEHESAEL